MSQIPLVSVVIIFLNEERFLAEAVDSVLAQTYAHWELLLVDDGSSDQSSAIAQTYAQQYPEQIRYLEHEGHQNRGMSASRNLGVSQAQGKYIAYLDGDDIWLPQKLGEQVALLQAHPAAVMVHGPLMRWYSWTGEPEQALRDNLFGAGKKQAHPFANQVVQPPQLLTLFLEDDFFIPGGILIERDVLLELGGYEETFRGMYEDTVMMTKVCLQKSVYVSNQCWYYYRMHPDACTFVAWQQGENDRAQMRYFNWLEQYLSANEVQDQRVWQALHRAQWRCRYAWLLRLLDYHTYIGPLERAAFLIGRPLLPPPIRRRLLSFWRRTKYTYLSEQ